MLEHEDLDPAAMSRNNEVMFPLLIKGGHIIDPCRGVSEKGNLLIVGSKIVSLQAGKEEKPPFSSLPGRMMILDAAGLIVCPGFVDLHCHLREPGFEEKETIATGTQAAAKGGFTTVCCMANTNPPLDSPVNVSWVKEKTAREGSVTVLPIGCISEGRKGVNLSDMVALAKAGVIGFSDDGHPVTSAELMRLAMIRAREVGLLVIDHCEDRAISANGVMNDGNLCKKLGLKGIPSAAEEVMVFRDLVLARQTGARVHIAHVSTKRSVEFIRVAKEEGIAVTAEVTPHHLTLTEQRVIGEIPESFASKEERNARGAVNNSLTLDTDAKVNPPLRAPDDIEALIQALKEGVIDAVATDHAPHTLADKRCEFHLAAFGISGLETAFGCLMSLVHSRRIGLTTLLSKLTHEPAKILGKESELGTLKPGAPANIILFDPNEEWAVDRRNFLSKGKNTPYHGCKFKGKIKATIANGRIVYLDEGTRVRLVTHSRHWQDNRNVYA